MLLRVHPSVFLYGLALGLLITDIATYAAHRYGNRLHRLRAKENAMNLIYLRGPPQDG